MKKFLLRESNQFTWHFPLRESNRFTWHFLLRESNRFKWHFLLREPNRFTWHFLLGESNRFTWHFLLRKSNRFICHFLLRESNRFTWQLIWKKCVFIEEVWHRIWYSSILCAQYMKTNHFNMTTAIIRAHLDWLNDHHRLKERQNKSCQPFWALVSSPLEAVQ